MAQIKCEYCGTMFDPDQGICPLCGIPEEEGLYTAPVATPPAPPVAAPKPPRQAPPARTRAKGGRSPQEEIERAAAKSAKSRRPNRNQKQEDKVPPWIAVTICGVLTIAVVIGGGIALMQTDIFKTDEETETSLSLPITSDAVEDGTVAEEEVIVVDPNVECTSLALNYTEVTLFDAGEQLTLKAITTPTEAADNVVWTSGDSAIATVSSAGVVTAVSGGTTTITASCGDQMSTSNIRCSFATVEDSQGQTNVAVDTTEDSADTTDFTASLSSTDFTMFDPGETVQLTVNGAPSSATVTWKIANEAVATVSDTGLVTGLKTGNTKVTCTVGDQVLECQVRCNMINSTNQGVVADGGAGDEGGTVSSNASLSHSDVTIAIGESFTLSVAGSTAVHVFSSDNTGYCTVDGNGTVTGTGYGTANVTTEVNGQTMTCVVRVG